jgi:hypothetical protein
MTERDNEQDGRREYGYEPPELPPIEIQQTEAPSEERGYEPPDPPPMPDPERD